MRRRENFSEKVTDSAWKRQAGLCALCGTHLALEDWDAHHADGNRSNAKTVGNCVLLHREPCHLLAHGEIGVVLLFSVKAATLTGTGVIAARRGGQQEHSR